VLRDLNSELYIVFFLLYASKFEYLEKSLLCYNVHPGIFDRLFDEVMKDDHIEDVDGRFIKIF
jgi:hypothetical protein